MKGEAWQQAACDARSFQPRLERMWARAGLPAPARAARLLPLQRRRQRDRDLRPRGPRQGDQPARLPAPAEERPHLPGGLLPPARLGRARRGRAAGRDRRPARHRAHGKKLEAEGEYSEQYFVARPRGAGGRGHGRVAAPEGARRPRHRRPPGPPLLVGLPGDPGAGRAREGQAPARHGADRHHALRRRRADARAVDGGDHRPPPAGRLLRHDRGPHPRGRVAGRGHRALRQGRPAAGRGSGRGGRQAPEGAVA